MQLWLECRDMNPTVKTETKRGCQEASKQFDVLRATWPQAFPTKSHLVRPLASGSARRVADALGWSPAYTRAVLRAWKLRDAYCKAVLDYPQRINLDGSASGEEIDDTARRNAKERLARIAKRQAKKAAKIEHKRRVGLAADLSEEWVEAVRNTQVPAQAAP